LRRGWPLPDAKPNGLAAKMSGLIESLYVLFMNFLRKPYAFSNVMVISRPQGRVVCFIKADSRR